MKINNLIYIVLLGIIVSLTSCEDDDSLFSGNENYITSFRLVHHDLCNARAKQRAGNRTNQRNHRRFGVGL